MDKESQSINNQEKNQNEENENYQEMNEQQAEGDDQNEQQQEDQVINQQQEEQQQQNQNVNQQQQFDFQPFQNAINLINNDAFLHEESLQGICDLLCLEEEDLFDIVDLRNDQAEENQQNKVEQQVEKILKKKIENQQKKINFILEIYQQKMPSKQMNNLEKIMSILKSKNKEVYIKKNVKQDTCIHCQCSAINAEYQNSIFQEPAQNINNNKDENTQTDQTQQTTDIQSEEIQKQEEAIQNQEQAQQQPEDNNQINQEIQNDNQDNQQINQENELIQQNEQQKEQEEIKQDQENQEEEDEESEQQKKNKILNLMPQQFMSIQDINNILSMKFVDLKLFKKYDPIENSITFDMNNNYSVIVKSCENIRYNTSSYCSKVPHFIFQDYIFPCLSSYELFKIRAVCHEWRLMIREVWHNTFKREMYEQLMAADLVKDIENQFKLVHIRNPFRSRLAILIKAIIEIINWNEFEKRCLDNDLTYKEKKIIVCILKMLGIYKFEELNQINEFQEKDFDAIKIDVNINLNVYMNKIFENNFHFCSSQDLKKFKANFLSDLDIQTSSYNNQEQKNSLLMVLYLKQLYIFSLIKNYIHIAQVYIQLAKQRLDKISKEWPENKGFLEGAYKILLLRNVKIVQGKVISEDSDNEEQGECTLAGSKKKEDQEEEEEQESEVSRLLKSVFNIQKQNGDDEPDFVLKRKGGQTKVFLDQGTKFDIILHSLMSVGLHKMQQLSQMQQKAQDIVEAQKHTLQELEEKLMYNKNQIEIMKQQKDVLEENLRQQMLMQQQQEEQGETEGQNNQNNVITDQKANDINENIEENQQKNELNQNQQIFNNQNIIQNQESQEKENNEDK